MRCENDISRCFCNQLMQVEPHDVVQCVCIEYNWFAKLQEGSRHTKSGKPDSGTKCSLPT